MAKDGLHWDASFRNDSAAGRPGDTPLSGDRHPTPPGPWTARLSVADGIRIRDVFGKMEENESQDWEYPGMLSSQMTAWHDQPAERSCTRPTATDTTSGSGCFAIAIISSRPSSISWSASRGPPSPSPTGPSWRPSRAAGKPGADVYRKWAVRQPWCRKTLRERTLPAAVARPSFVLCSHIRLRGREAGHRRVLLHPAVRRGIPAGLEHAHHQPVLQLGEERTLGGAGIFPAVPSRGRLQQMTGLIHGQGDQTMVLPLRPQRDPGENAPPRRAGLQAPGPAPGLAPGQRHSRAGPEHPDPGERPGRDGEEMDPVPDHRRPRGTRSWTVSGRRWT